MKRRPVHKRIGPAAGAFWRELSGTVKQRTDYAGAANHRLLQDWIARSLLADEQIMHDIKRSRARARELGRNDGNAKRYFRLLQNNVIGPSGITLQARLKNGEEFDEATNKLIETHWKAWASRPITLDGKLNLRRYCRQLIRTVAEDGEALVRLWKGHGRYGLALQSVDADVLDETFNRPRTAPGMNEVRMGVEVDPFGRVVAYHLRQDLDSWRTNIARVHERVLADQIIHLYDPDRVNQTRGITWLHSIMVPAHMLGGYEESEAIAARIAASMGGFFIPSADSGEIADGEQPVEMEAAPGSFQIGPAGATFAQFDPKHPTAQFPAFVKQLLRRIASGLNVFYNVLANDGEGVTYSTMRSFLLVERDDWKAIAEDFIDMFLRPLYETWLETAMLVGAFPGDFLNFERYLAVEFESRGWTWIDPEKEANGFKIAVDSGLDTLTRIHAEKGRSIEDVFAERARELQLAKKYGIPLAPAGTPAPISAKPQEDDDDEPNGNGNGKQSTERTFMSRAHVAR